MSAAAQQKPWPAMSIAEANAILTAPGARFEIEEVVIRGIRTKTWKNAPPSLRAVMEQGAAFGARDLIVHEGERVTHGAFGRAVRILAAALVADGVQKGDRVAVLMRNMPEWPVAFFAAAICGAIVVPLNAWWTGAELEYGLTDSGAKVLLADWERHGRLIEHYANCPALERIFIARAERSPGDPRARALEDVIGEASAWASLADVPYPDVALGPEDDVTIFYTSGTTGRPKGALATHRNITTNIMTSGATAARAFLRRGETPPVVGPNTPPRVTLLAVPFFHVTGCSATLVPAVASGGKLVIMRKWDAEKAMALIQQEKVTATGGVPTIAWQIIEHPNRAHYDLSSIESVAYGGAPSAPDLVRKIKEVFPKSQPGNAWGMTETTATFSGHGGEDYLNRPDSCGPACAVGELKIAGDDGVPAPVNTVGELWAKGPQVVKGYWNKPKETAETFIDGWVRTGDLAFLDEEGFCTIVDRAKDMLIRGGENIYCVEVENVLYDHPAVTDAALVGRPHRTLGEEPVAIVHLQPGERATAEELRAFVAARLAAFKVPVEVYFSDDILPRNANGKIMKPDVKRTFVV